MKVYQSITELTGNTPLLRLKHLEEANETSAVLLGKLEYLNHAGSVKDRIALSMVNAAEKAGKLTPGATLIEATSGNTGIGLASIAATRGYRLILTMPETMSIERRNLLAAYGAELVLTEGKQGMRGALEKAASLANEIPGSFIPSQFENTANSDIHYATTGPEIYRDTDGKIDILVAGIGTGGTITGAGKYLKEQNPAIQVVAVEPADSAILSGSAPGPHGIQGLGAGFVPEILDTKIYDEVLTVPTENAYETGRFIANREGVLLGISSGAAAWAAAKLAKRPENAGKTIVVILPDTGERYLSTPMFKRDA